MPHEKVRLHDRTHARSTIMATSPVGGGGATRTWVATRRMIHGAGSAPPTSVIVTVAAERFRSVTATA